MATPDVEDAGVKMPIYQVAIPGHPWACDLGFDLLAWGSHGLVARYVGVFGPSCLVYKLTECSSMVGHRQGKVGAWLLLIEFSFVPCGRPCPYWQEQNK